MLHAPLGVPVRLVMTSQDVIHSFYVPAFRMKQDVLPGRYTETWFKALRPGTYDLYCSEYCGLDHSAMTGHVVIMAPADYARWARAQPDGDSLATQGQATFVSLGCSGCHGVEAKVAAPPLTGVYGRRVALADGRRVTADETYLRDAILDPAKNRVAGYAPAMPSYQGVASEEDTVALVAYLKSLSAPPATEAAR
jgi:cytochrome c oxidase subunit 2